MEVNLCRYTVDKIALIYHYLMATVEAATEILELNAELNALLFSTSLEEILKNITRTTIASSGIGQDVLADDAEHEFRTKFKHDIVRKGKTKIVVPKEHEEDEEEEEE
ncbi:unnamed protein product [Prunus armeniaca]